MKEIVVQDGMYFKLLQSYLGSFSLNKIISSEHNHVQTIIYADAMLFGGQNTLPQVYHGCSWALEPSFLQMFLIVRHSIQRYQGITISVGSKKV